ncbi:MAG: hypothetical protein QNJ35_00080 [Paracoccaceae bacterium]|nr:hypothetical protein [Paracoccaceae bacterium]
MASRLYGGLERTEALAPDKDLESLCMAYLDIASAGACGEDQRHVFFEAGRRMIEEPGRGCDPLGWYRP